MTYVIYGKHKTDKQFRPMDMTDGSRVVNLFYASMFYDLEQVKRIVEEITNDNAEWQFKYRNKG
jgi:hypothetical protein